jgi:hypothetical protein|tara:strand:- start:152 stop:511 length:360 start_codon:yes stop_codon:yes gene_type:complete
MNIGNIFKSAIGGAIGWIGGTIGGAVGGPGGAKVGRMIGSKFATSLMTKKPGHGDWAPIDTSVAAPNLGEFGVGVKAMSDAEAPPRGAKTADGNDLNYIWDRRLVNAIGKQKEYERTFT